MQIAGEDIMKKRVLFMSMMCIKLYAVGIVNGKLTPCNGAWNCTITQEVDGQKPNAQPIRYAGSRKKALARLKAILQTFDRVNIITETDDYLYATFTSKFFKFVDEVEFYAPKDEKVIHIRSAARAGVYDFGVNKKRVREIVKQFEKDKNK